MKPAAQSVAVSAARARALWLRAQRLDTEAPFGAGPDAVRQATEHLGYVQIDTIQVIERSHHHIYFTRIPGYRPGDLEQAQSVDKSVFEYWAHALAYLPTADYRHFVAAMRAFRDNPARWYQGVDPAGYARLLRRIRDQGPLTLRDIDDDVLVEKDHPWASRKPSRRALQYGFHAGDLTVSQRLGMLKTYELSNRHFGWARRPGPLGEGRFARYLVERALRSQGMASLDSICYGNAACKPVVRAWLESLQRRGEVAAVHLEAHPGLQHWVRPEALDETLPSSDAPPVVHLLSPFDPLVIQRKRLELFFGYRHRFEAYLPPGQRVLGYFALPVLAGDRIVAAADLKMDRRAARLLTQKWTWFTRPGAKLREAVDRAMGRFEDFQRAGINRS